MLGFELDLGAFARSAEAARERVEQRMREAIGAAGDDIAHASRADHPYTDRTGDLTRRTRAYAPLEPCVTTECNTSSFFNRRGSGF